MGRSYSEVQADGQRELDFDQEAAWLGRDHRSQLRRERQAAWIQEHLADLPVGVQPFVPIMVRKLRSALGRKPDIAEIREAVERQGLLELDGAER